VAALDAALAQPGSGAIGQPVELAVGVLAVAHHEGGSVRVFVGPAREVLCDEGRAQDFFDETNFAIASIEPKFSSVISTSSISRTERDRTSSTSSANPSESMMPRARKSSPSPSSTPGCM